MRALIALIIIIPALEIGLLIFSGKTIGLLPTITLIILTGVLGAWLAKKQGLEIIRKAQEQMGYGQIPGFAIIDGICILAGAIFLLTPGFITDLTGLFLLIPQTRHFIKPFIGKLFQRMIDKGRFTIIKQ